MIKTAIKHVVAALLMLATTAVIADTPNGFINSSSQKILNILKANEGKPKGQIQQEIQNTATSWFDFNKMTALAVGQHWHEATLIQQDKLVEEFKTLLINTYAGFIVNFKNARIDVKPNPIYVERGEAPIAIVKTQVTLPGSKRKIIVEYALNKYLQEWKIFNVSVEGASLVTIYRNQFNHQITRNGFDGLIQLLQNKNRRK